MQIIKISENDIDILSEAGNIGAGHAATALSIILNQQVNLSLSKAVMTDLTNIKHIISGNVIDDFFVISFDLSVFLEGKLLWIIDEKDTENISAIASQGYEIDKIHVIQEISNMICASYVNSLSSLIKQNIDISVPDIKFGQLDTLLPEINELNSGESLFLVKTELYTNEIRIKGNLLLVLKPESLKKTLYELEKGYKNHI